VWYTSARGSYTRAATRSCSVRLTPLPLSCAGFARGRQPMHSIGCARGALAPGHRAAPRRLQRLVGRLWPMAFMHSLPRFVACINTSQVWPAATGRPPELPREACTSRPHRHEAPCGALDRSFETEPRSENASHVRTLHGRPSRTLVRAAAAPPPHARLLRRPCLHSTWCSLSRRHDCPSNGTAAQLTRAPAFRGRSGRSPLCTRRFSAGPDERAAVCCSGLFGRHEN
jgi:hypothetical protein